MGASAAVSRVLVVAMVRDLFEGEQMARVMSLTFMVFMVVPVVAPTIGQGILLAGPWRLIFIVLGSYGLFLGLWSWLRLPETLHPEYRRALNASDIFAGIRQALTDRLSLGYTMALTATFGGLTAYIASIQQIVFEAFNVPRAIGIVFALVAAPMALASWGNSRIVTRFGLRRVGHSGLISFTMDTVLHAAIAFYIDEPLRLFVGLMSAAFVGFAFTSSNLSTLAMHNMAPIAGTASSVQGVIGTIGGAAIGFAIGQSFDGSVRPFLVGLAGCALAAVAATLVTERGRLFAAPERPA